MQVVEPALFDGQLDIGEDAGVIGFDQGQPPALATGAAHGDGLVENLGGEIALILVCYADALFVLLELVHIVGFGKQVFQNNRVRDADGVGVGHGADDLPLGECLVAFDIDLAHLHFGPLVHVERDAERRGRNLLDDRIDSGVLASAFGKKLFEDDGGALDLIGIVLRLDRQTDAPVFEAVEHFGDGGRFQALIVDGAHDAAFHNYISDDEARTALFDFDADIVKAAGVVENAQIVGGGLFAVDIPRLGGDERFQGVLWHAARAPENHGFDDRARGLD